MVADELQNSNIHPMEGGKKVENEDVQILQEMQGSISTVENLITFPTTAKHSMYVFVADSLGTTPINAVKEELKFREESVTLKTTTKNKLMRRKRKPASLWLSLLAWKMRTYGT